jgi:hypothetical protein
MKIINPLYDKAFKYLMENNKFARKVLSVIMDVEVEEVSLGQQETVFPDEKRSLTLFRLDFKAVIKEADGSRKTVLIELQKSKYATDIQRFRNYLGANYMTKQKKPLAVEENRAEYFTTYPVIAIYILGYNLDDLPYMAVTVNHEVINSVNKEVVKVKSFFVEHLTHQSHIIQVRRLPEKRRTRLENFLLLFNQAWCTDENYIIDLQEIPEGFADIAEYLQGPLKDETFRRNLEAEEEIDDIFDAQEAKYLKQLADSQKKEKLARRREEAQRKQKEEQRKQKEEQRKQKEEERRQKEEALKQKESLALKLAIRMKSSGASIEDIIEETELSADELDAL